MVALLQFGLKALETMFAMFVRSDMNDGGCCEIILLVLACEASIQSKSFHVLKWKHTAKLCNRKSSYLLICSNSLHKDIHTSRSYMHITSNVVVGVELNSPLWLCTTPGQCCKSLLGSKQQYTHEH
jgi:hypothetical protein